MKVIKGTTVLIQETDMIIHDINVTLLACLVVNRKFFKS